MKDIKICFKGGMRYFLILLTFIFPFSLVAQDSVQVDRSIRYGKLENGFTYYIKHLAEPQAKLYMRFLSKAGYDQHDPDQLNTAHAVEHLAFKATRNFPEGISYSPRIQKLGVGLYDKLAFSGPKGVTYYFDAPPGSPEALEAGLLFFKDIASGLNLTEKDIHSVRGELRQEFLEGKNDLELSAAESRLKATIFPCSQDKTNFLEYHKTFKPEVLRRFYKDWYRPDLLSLVIVGNIKDVNALEKRIKESFSTLKPLKNARKLRNCDSIYFNQPPQFHIVRRPVRYSDKPDTQVDLQLIYRDPLTNKFIPTMDGQKRLILLNAVSSLITRRYEELSASSSLQFTAEYEYPLGLKISGTIEDGGINRKLPEIMRPILQLQQYEVSEADWEDIKQGQLELLHAEYEQGARYYIDEIEEHFFLNEPLPANKQQLLISWLSRLTAKEFNRYLHDFFKKEPEDLGLLVPEGHPAASLSEEKVRSWIRNQQQERIEPYKPPKVPESLLSKKKVAKLQVKDIMKRKTGVSGAEEVVLSNRLRLVIKPLESSPGMNQDKFMIHGFTRKGADCFKKKDFFSAVHAPRIVNASGIGGLRKAEVERFLKKHGMLPGVVSLYVDRYDSGIQANSTLGNLENVLQLIYLYMSSPNKDSDVFEKWKAENQQLPKGLYHFDFHHIVKSLTGDTSMTWDIFGRKYPAKNTDFIEEVRLIDQKQAYDQYRHIFSNAKDFTFVISGNFKIENILPLFQKYLGNIPNSETLQNCSFKEKSPTGLPEGKISFKISAPNNADMQNVKYGIKFITPYEDPLDWKEHLRVQALGTIVRHIMWTLRFERGFSVYDVSGRGDLKENLSHYEISSFLDCMPEEFPKIQKEMYTLISGLKTNVLPEESFKVGMKRMYALYDAEGRGNAHRESHNRIYRHYRYGQPLIDPEEAESFVKSLTPKDIMEAAQKYLRDEGFYEFVMQDDSF